MDAKQTRPSPPLDLEYASEEAQDMLLKLAEQKCGLVYSASLPKPSSRATRTNNVLKFMKAREIELKTIKLIKVEWQDVIQNRRNRAVQHKKRHTP